MSNISIRLPPEIEKGLDEEARLTERNRSDLVREAVGQYLSERKRQRAIKEYAEEMRRAYSDPEYAAEMRRIQHDFDEADNFIAVIEAEERAAGIDPDEKWWE
jgi:predicted transcriptional regulator